MVKVSVIIPCYNVVKYIRQCLDSVVKQTLRSIEIIIVDNGASDEEKSIIHEFSENNENIKVISFEKNQGYGKAVNSAIDLAEGEYIGIVEGDDYIEPDMFQELYNVAADNDADIVKSSFYELNGTEVSIGIQKEIEIATRELLDIDKRACLLSFHPSIWSCIYKRDFLKKNNIKFIEMQGANWVDNPFQVETFLAAERFVYIDNAFYYYRKNRETSSSCLPDGLDTPLNAVKMVQNVIDKNSVTNKYVLSNLALRHWAYIKILISKMHKDNLKEIKDYTTEIFDLIAANLEDNCKYKRYKKRFYNKDLTFQFVKLEIRKHYLNMIHKVVRRSNR